MPIQVQFFSSLRAAADTQGVMIEARDVGEAVKALKKMFRQNMEFIRLLKISNVILNGQNILFLRGAKTKLKDGDRLAFFTPLGGG